MEVHAVKLAISAIDRQILIARDDAFPLFQGGNKARKMVGIIDDIEKNNRNAVVTTGGVQSNHCRVVALACAKNGWECTLVLHGTRERFYQEKGNALIMRISGARIKFAQPSEISSVMDASMKEFRAEGLRPYYLNGGGHNRAGVTSYLKAIYELKDSLPAGMLIDHIFLASGTGSTQAGIIAGCKEVGWTQSRIHGISIAREKERGIESIIESLGYISQFPHVYRTDILFYDDFLFGGYEKSNKDLSRFLFQIAKGTGLVLDETYTGKAFYGMLEIIKRKKLHGNILFWHTGGLLNLMA